MDRPVWTCPDCGREFVTARASHSCIPRRGWLAEAYWLGTEGAGKRVS